MSRSIVFGQDASESFQALLAVTLWLGKGAFVCQLAGVHPVRTTMELRALLRVTDPRSVAATK